MIPDHKSLQDINSTVKQDTTKTSKPVLLLNPAVVADSLSKNGSNLLITKPKSTFIPLPSVDSVRQAPRKMTYYNPLKTAEYLKYKDSYFETTEGGLLFTQKSFNPQNEYVKKIKVVTQKNSRQNIQGKTDFESIIEQPHLLNNKILIAENKPNTTQSTGWVLGILIFITVIFAWIRVFNNKYLRNLKTALLNNQWSKKLYEERSVVTQRNSIVLNLFFITNLSLLLVFLLKYYRYTLLGMNLFQTFWLFVIMLAVVYFIKFILLRILGWLLLAKPQFGEYIHNLFLFNKLYGIILFPVLWTIPFVDQKVSEILIILAVGLFGVAYLLRIFRGILNCIRINVSLFYLILYLCALEILPMLIIYKTITSVM